MKYSGPDPEFPYLNENERFSFPPPEKAKDSSVVCWGGNLSPGMLLSAYEQGIFPWYSEGEPLLWHSPDPRFVLFPEKLHVSHTMKKVLTRPCFEIALDRDFGGVISACSQAPRPGQDGTWITGEVIAAYTRLHQLGWAHSAEAYAGGELAGGCYGIRLGNVFFGESMFAKKPNASKAAFLTLARLLFEDGVVFIDCQVHTDHLESLGGEEIGRKEFLKLLGETLSARIPHSPAADQADRRGNWGGRYYLIPSPVSPPSGR
jgi:leucyl/phenylalanyl-tRNA--protein transferase